MSDSPEAYKAGDQVLFYAIGDSEPSEGEIVRLSRSPSRPAAPFIGCSS